MYIQTEISKEVHRNLFIHWTSKFAEKKDEYVYILREEEEDDDQLQRILNDYSSIGLPGSMAQLIVCTLDGIDVLPTRRIYLKVPRGIPQLFLRWFLITEERFYQSATYTQEQEMTNT